MLKKVTTITIALGFIASIFSCSNLTNGSSSNEQNYEMSYKAALYQSLKEKNPSRSISEADKATMTFDETSAIAYMKDNYAISNDVSAYISEINKIIDDEELSIEETIEQINVLKSSISNLTDEELVFLNYYADTSSVVLEYFENNDEISSRGVKSWLKKKSKKIAGAVVSAAFGAGIGLIAGGNPVSIVAGAVTGAVAGYNAEGIAIKVKM